MTDFSLERSAEQIIQQLVRSPRLPQITQQLEAILQAEQERRARFYEEMSEGQKVEFINGEVVVQTPVRLRHNESSSNLATLLRAYVQRHNLGVVGHEKLLVTLTRNDYEPDICFWGRAKAAAFTPDQMKFPAPDLVVEVLFDSTAEIDRGIKFVDYALHGVGEYWIVDADQESVEQYLLHGETYELAVKVKAGTIQSAVVEGFDIPVRAIFDSAQQIETLQAILR